MKSLEQVVQQLLIKRGHGSDPELAEPTDESWPVFYGTLPDEPNNAIAVRGTSGVLQGRIMRDGESVYFPGLQIMVRGIDYAAGNSKIQDIVTDLNDVFMDEVYFESDGEGYRVDSLHRSSGLASLGPEESNNRELFTQNYLGTYEAL